VSVGVPVGQLFRPTSRLDIGVAYRSGAFGTGRDNVPIIGSGVLTLPGQTSGLDVFARVTGSLPHTVLAGAQVRLTPRWDLGLTLRWLHFTDEAALDVRLSGAAVDGRNVPDRVPLYRGYRDTVMARAVGSWRGARWRLGVGGLVTSPSVEEQAVSPAVVDGWQLGGVLLAEAQLTRWLTVTLGYGLRGIVPRSVTRSAFDPLYEVDCVRSRYDIPTCRLANQGRGAGQAAGDYGAYTHDLGATTTVSF